MYFKVLRMYRGSKVIQEMARNEPTSFSALDAMQHALLLDPRLISVITTPKGEILLTSKAAAHNEEVTIKDRVPSRLNLIASTVEQSTTPLTEKIKSMI